MLATINKRMDGKGASIRITETHLRTEEGAIEDVLVRMVPCNKYADQTLLFITGIAKELNDMDDIRIKNYPHQGDKMMTMADIAVAAKVHGSMTIKIIIEDAGMEIWEIKKSEGHNGYTYPDIKRIATEGS